MTGLLMDMEQLLDYIVQVPEKSGTNGNFIYSLLLTLDALHVHPDTLRIFSAALPCLCGFCSTYWDRQ
jgi:hypothetical protein